jgi:ribonuclease-3 family protein
MVAFKKENEIANNTGTLAFIGDAVFELHIREYALHVGIINLDELNRFKVRYVRAEAQALAIKAMQDSLSNEEAGIVRRARNKKTTTKAKNAELMDYKWATAFEALIGYHYIQKNKDRLRQLINTAINIIEEHL